jgi:hypothetical protein
VGIAKNRPLEIATQSLQGIGMDGLPLKLKCSAEPTAIAASRRSLLAASR